MFRVGVLVLGLICIFLTALTLRLWRLDYQSLWYDEFLTVQAAKMPFAALYDQLAAAESNKPPLHFLILHWVVRILPGDYWLRVPSAIFGAATCVIGVLLGQRMLGQKWGWMLGLLLAFSPMHVFYSQEVRMYSMWVFFVSGAMLCHIAYCNSPSRASLVGYTALAILSCYTFTFGIFIAGFSLIFGYFFRPSLTRKHLVRLAVANGLIILAFVPWLLRIASSVARGVGFQETERGSLLEAAAYALFSLGFGSSLGPDRNALQRHGVGVLRELPLESALLCGGFAFLVALLFVALARAWKANRNLFWFGAAGIAAFWLGPAVLSGVSQGVPFNARYGFASIIPFLALIAGSFQLQANKGVVWVICLIFCVGVTCSLYNYFTVPSHGRDDMRQAGKFLAELSPPPEKIIICAGYLKDVFQHYYRQPSNMKAVLRVKPEPSEDSLEAIAEYVASVRRFALVFSRPDHGDPQRVLIPFFESQYETIVHRHWTGVDVYLFSAP